MILMTQRVIGSSVIGYSHIRNGVECQDSIGKLTLGDGVFLLAVADGHGSSNCPYSKDGSDRACRAFLGVMKDLYTNYEGNLDSLATYLNREGDTSLAMTVCLKWQEKVKRAHQRAKRDMPLDEEGKIDKAQLLRLYGTTLIGLLVTKEYLFGLQIGDGDLSFVSNDGFQSVIVADKFLGVETHSLSKLNAWTKAITVLRRYDSLDVPSVFLLTTDGFANSFAGENGYQKACVDYFETLKTYGADAVEGALPGWLSETSEQGCGDDISMLLLYTYDEEDSAVQGFTESQGSQESQEPHAFQESQEPQEEESHDGED